MHFMSFFHIDTGSWNPCSNKIRTYLSYIVSIMGTDDLATQAAMASATMILVYPLCAEYIWKKNKVIFNNYMILQHMI